MFKCQECGKKFRTVKSAERASYNGCPGCGGVDIDLDVSSDSEAREQEGMSRRAARHGSDFLDHDHSMNF